MFDVLKTFTAARLAAAGRQARSEVAAAAGQIGEQVAEAAATAAGELVRCAVAGAIAAAVSGPHRVGPVDPPASWDESDDLDDLHDRKLEPQVPDRELCTDAPPNCPRWARASRAASCALMAAAVPGGRVVAAGLGGLAAVAGLAARAAEPTE